MLMPWRRRLDPGPKPDGRLSHQQPLNAPTDWLEAIRFLDERGQRLK
jgi:hypothetical protein